MASMRFTARSVQAMKPPATGRVEVFDATTPGFGLRVTARGRRTWCVMYRFEGRVERLTIGDAGKLSLAEARQRAKAVLADASRGVNAAAVKRAGRRAETFGEVAERYLEEHAKPRKRSWRRDQEILDRDVLPAIGRLKANKVGRGDVRAILRAIVGRGAPVMANRTLEVIRAVFNWALREEVGDLAANPCAQMLPPGGAEPSRERALTEAEIATLWTALDGVPVAAGQRLALRLILVTGQRKGEVATARRAEIDRAAAVWTIPAARSKNGIAHRVPLSPLALTLIDQAEALAGQAPWLFPSPRSDRPVTPNALNNALYRHRAAFGIAAFTPHDLRRTAATAMAGLGIPRVTLGKVLNHVEPGVTAIYDRHGYDLEKRRALDAWGARLAEIVGIAPTAAGNVIELGRR